MLLFRFWVLGGKKTLLVIHECFWFFMIIHFRKNTYCIHTSFLLFPSYCFPTFHTLDKCYISLSGPMYHCTTGCNGVSIRTKCLPATWSLPAENYLDYLVLKPRKISQGNVDNHLHNKYSIPWLINNTVAQYLVSKWNLILSTTCKWTWTGLDPNYFLVQNRRNPFIVFSFLPAAALLSVASLWRLLHFFAPKVTGPRGWPGDFHL